MVILSLKQTDIILLSSILSKYETETRQYEILKIFDKMTKITKSRLLKAAIKDNMRNFKNLNKIKDLKVYNKK